MATYAWAKSRALFSKLRSEKNQPVANKTDGLNKHKDRSEMSADSNQRFLSAIREGGIFLS